MKKKTLVLLVTVILAAAVCAGLALLLRQEPESPASQKTAAQTLLNRSEAEVRSVTVTSAGRAIAASRDQNGTLVSPRLTASQSIRKRSTRWQNIRLFCVHSRR